MSQQCVLIMHMAEWGISVASRSLQGFPPSLGTGVATAAVLCPALGPPSSTEMFGNWTGCREEVTSFSLEGSKWTFCFTRKVVQHWNREVVGCPSFDVFKALWKKHWPCLVLMIVLSRAAGWTWMTSHPFLPTSISEMLWVTPEFQVKPVEKTKSGREQNFRLSFPVSGPLLLSPYVGHGELADRGEQANRNQPLLQRNSDSPQKSPSCAVDVAWVLWGGKVTA